MSGSTYDEPNSGVTAGIFPFPAFETFPEERRRLFCCVSPTPILASEEAERKYQRYKLTLPLAGTCRATIFVDSGVVPVPDG